MLELTEQELLSVESLENESYKQYKARRRILKDSLALYLKTDTQRLKTSYFEFVQLCIKLSQVKY